MNIYCYKYTPDAIKWVGVLDDFQSFSFRRSYSGVGEFQLYINSDTLNGKQVKDFDIIQIAPKTAGLVTSINVKRGNENVRVVKGIELKGIMRQRIIIPPTGKDELSYSNKPATDIINGIIDTQIISPEDGNRTLSLTKIAECEAGPLTYYNGRLSNCEDDIVNVAAANNVGWYADIESGFITFGCFLGKNRTEGQSAEQRIVLSVANNNLEFPEISYSPNWINTAYTAGQGEGAARRIITVYQDGETAGFGRYELYVDARDIQDDAELPSRGAEKLSEYGSNVVYNAAFSPGFLENYRAKFDIGDMFTIKDTELPGGKIDIRLTEIEEVYENGMRTLNATFGYNGASLNSMFARIKNQNKAINAR